MTCAFSVIYVFLQKRGPSTQEGDLILVLSLVSVPVLEFAVMGPKGQRASLFLDEARIMTGILVLFGNCPCSMPPISPFLNSL